MPTAWRALVVLLIAAAATVAIGLLVGLLVARARPRSTIASLVHAHCHHAFVAFLVTVGWLAVLPATGLDAGTRANLRHGLTVLAIGAGAWLFTGLLFVAQDLAFAHARVDVSDNLRARRVRTQIAILRRLTVIAVTILAVASILMSFARFRTFGASLLASAGLIGVVAGVASQSSLTNVFAGVQLAFSDSLRIDDVVVVEEEWGRVEELTLMNVTLHLWDDRRLILPTSYFTTTPFQNWTRRQSRLLGSVLLYVDFSTPMDELRAQTFQIVSNSPHWDQRNWVVQVVDSTPSCMVVRVLATATDASSAFSLRCDIREGLLGWMYETHPEALPRVRSAEAAAVSSGPG